MNPEVEKLQNAVDMMRVTLPMLMEYNVVRAKLAKSQFNALINEGFTPVQALGLVKAWKP